MASLIKYSWPPDPFGPTEEDRLGGEYDVYLPGRLAERPLYFDPRTAAELGAAEAALARFCAVADGPLAGEVVGRALVRAEGVASARLAGVEVDAREVLRADLERPIPWDLYDLPVREAASSVAALAYGLDEIDGGAPITADLLIAVHLRLLAERSKEVPAGALRQVQTWVGGSAFNPCRAEYVPPPPEAVEELVDDLLRFCNDATLPPVAQAALAFAQLEAVRPFADGNGRAARALAQLVLRSRRAAVLPLPISLAIASSPDLYVRSLQAYRYRGPADGPQAREGTNRWVAAFARACRLAAARAASFTDRLKGAGILRQTSPGRRHRVFEAPEVFELWLALQRPLEEGEG